MLQVSVREFKHRLSKYIHLAETGATVVVTLHHKPVAKLSMVEAVAREVTLLAKTKELGMKWNGKKPAFKHARTIVQSKKTVAKRILEDRI